MVRAKAGWSRKMRRGEISATPTPGRAAPGGAISAPSVSALFSALFERLRQRGFHAAFAGIAIPNPASEALHQTMGFTAVGIYREVGYKMGGWRDVGWWQRLL